MRPNDPLPFLTLSALLIAACADPAPAALPLTTSSPEPDIPEPDPLPPALVVQVPQEGETPPSQGETPPSQGETPPHLVATWTAAGHLVLIDPTSGAVLSEAPAGDLGGEVDLTWDPYHGRIVVFEGDSEAQWGEVSTYPFTFQDGTPALGDRTHQVWIDGIARVAPSPFGIVIVEDGYGPRYRLVSDTGTPTASVFGPRPMSLEYGLSQSGEFHLGALTRGQEDDGLDLRTTLVLPEGVQVPSVEGGPSLPAPAAESARWVRSEAGSFVVGALSGGVGIASLGAGGWSSFQASNAGLGVTRIEDAAAVADGSTLVLLTSGDVDLVALRLGVDGEVECSVGLDLPGIAELAPLFFERRLLQVGPDRVLVSTSGGVSALTLSGACPLTLSVDPAFAGDALRGPLAACPQQF